MPNYNIELRTENRVWETLAVQVENLTALRVQVAKFVGHLLQDHAQEVWVDEEWRVDVTDDRGLILYVMQLTATSSPATAPVRR